MGSQPQNPEFRKNFENFHPFCCLVLTLFDQVQHLSPHPSGAVNCFKSLLVVYGGSLFGTSHDIMMLTIYR